MDSGAKIARIIETLHEAGDPTRAVGEKKYLKSEIAHFGVDVPKIRRIALGWSRGAKMLTREELIAVALRLWESEVHEARVAAAEMLKARAALLAVGDFQFLEGLVRSAKTWALVDNLSTGVCASLYGRIDGAGEVLDRWAADGDFWVRRAALLTLLPSLRSGSGDFARFCRYADAMLGEKQFFIRKAIGWALRETAKKRPEMVAAWLRPRIFVASGLTVRAAVKHMPEKLKRELTGR